MEDTQHILALEKIDAIIQNCLKIEANENRSGLHFYLETKSISIPEEKSCHNAIPQDLILQETETLFLRKLMVKMDLITEGKEITCILNEGVQSRTNIHTFHISLSGYKHAKEISSTSSSNQAFIAMSFDDQMDSTGKQIIEVVKECGYTPCHLKLTEHSEHNENITFQIQSAIKNCRFLIADFTQNKGGVYWEAGYAKGLGKEVIHCVQTKDEKSIHFDIKQINFIFWDSKEDLTSKLKERIQATID